MIVGAILRKLLSRHGRWWTPESRTMPVAIIGFDPSLLLNYYAVKTPQTASREATDAELCAGRGCDISPKLGKRWRLAKGQKRIGAQSF